MSLLNRSKLLISSVCLVLFTFGLIPQIQSKADANVYGDWEYRIVEDYGTHKNYIALTKYNGSDISPVIPTSIDGVAVKNLSGDDELGTFQGNEKITSIIIPEGIISLGYDTFMSCTNLKSIYIPSTIVDDGRFSPNEIEDGYPIICYNLETIEVHPDNKYYLSENGILFDKDKSSLISYPRNKKGDVYTVPDGVKYLGDRSFGGNRNIKKLILSKTVTGVHMDALSGNSFKKVVIPDNVFNIWIPDYEHWDFTVYGYKYSTAIREVQRKHFKYKYINVNAPTDIKINKNKGSVSLGWKPSDNASGYEIWRLDPGYTKYKKITTLSSRLKNSFTDKKVIRNKSYKYYVHSYRMVKEGEFFTKAGKKYYPVKKLMSIKKVYLSVKVR